MVIITGATGGVGQALAEICAREGQDVCVCCHTRCDDADRLCRTLAERYGVRAVWQAVDLASATSIRSAFDYFLSVFGHCDYLINNAAVSLVKPVSMMTDAEWERVIAVDLSACYYTCRCVLDGMYHRGGSIVNVSSMWGQLGASCEVAYSAAKAGVEGLTKALAEEYDGTVRVNALSLGFVDTPMNGHLSAEEKAQFFADNPTMRCLSAQEAAEAVWRLATDTVSGCVERLGW